MKKEITLSAKSVEEAVSKAVIELGAPSAEKIEYTVIEEAKKGFLGIGATEAKITATYTTAPENDAFEFVKKLIADMGLDAEVSMTDGEAGDHKIQVNGDSAAILIGHHGETLDSLQYLAGLAANKHVGSKKENYVRVSVDIEGYRAKREETLRALARKMAAKVIKYKRSVMLEPMNPYERRIIHSEIQEIEGVSTNSIGSDNNRKVVIFIDGEGK